MHLQGGARADGRFAAHVGLSALVLPRGSWGGRHVAAWLASRVLSRPPGILPETLPPCARPCAHVCVRMQRREKQALSTHGLWPWGQRQAAVQRQTHLRSLLATLDPERAAAHPAACPQPPVAVLVLLDLICYIVLHPPLAPPWRVRVCVCVCMRVRARVVLRAWRSPIRRCRYRASPHPTAGSRGRLQHGAMHRRRPPHTARPRRRGSPGLVVARCRVLPWYGVRERAQHRQHGVRRTVPAPTQRAGQCKSSPAFQAIERDDLPTRPPPAAAAAATS